MDIRTKVISQFQIVFIQYKHGMTLAVDTRHIDGHVVGNVSIDEFFSARSGDSVFSRIGHMEKITKGLVGEDGSSDAGVEDEFQWKFSVEHDRHHHQIIIDFNGYVNLGATIGECKPEVLRPDNHGKQPDNQDKDEFLNHGGT